MIDLSRREFLSKAGAATTLLPLVSAETFAKSFEQDKILGVALVGLGYYSEFRLAPALLETKSCKLTSIVTGTPAKAEKWKKQFNISDKSIYNYQTFDKIADNKDIDVVYVALPNAMHHEFVIRAAKAGKQVICEKPMAVSVKECTEMIDACKKANVKLYIGYRLHFEPFNMMASQVGKNEAFGKVKFVEASMGFRIGDPTQWRLKKSLAGGGAMMDVGIYAIQGARYSIGKEPISVTAREFKTDLVKFKEVDETIVWQMEFPGGVVSNSLTSYASSVERLFISAENGWLELQPAFAYGPLAGRTHQGPLNIPHTNHQALQLEAMGMAILENKDIDATGEEGLRDMKVIEAIYRAIETGKKETC